MLSSLTATDKSVLLVEDLTFTRATMARTIQSIDACDVSEAESGEQAFEMLQSGGSFDVIVADIMMPGSNGLELLKSVRTGKTAAAPDTPFIIVSGALTEPVLGALSALDVFTSIGKPATKVDLANAMENLVSPPCTTKNYNEVDVSGLLDIESPAQPNSDNLVSFLNAAPVLSGLTSGELALVAATTRKVHFSVNTVIDPDDFTATQLPLIIKGEAEILQSVQLPSGETIEHRAVLLEAGNALGTFNFMAEANDFEHPKVRTTRGTEVVVLDFANDDPHSDLSVAEAKVKQTIGKILAERINYSDRALAVSLTNQLAETRVKRTAGGYVIMMFVMLAIYTLGMRVLLDIELSGSARSMSSVAMLLIFLTPFVIILKSGNLKAADLGLTLLGWRSATREAVIFSMAFIAVLTGLKVAVVTMVPAFQDQSIFAMSQDFSRLTSTGSTDWVFYATNVLVYALFVPIQEIIARCGIQSLLVEFLYGSPVRRAVISIVASNFVFAAAHTHLNIGFALATFVAGLFFGWLFHRNKSIVGVTVAHIMIGGIALFALGLEEFLR